MIQKRHWLWFILVLLGVACCQGKVIEQSVSSILPTPVSSMVVPRTPTPPSASSSVLPTPLVATKEAEGGNILTPLATLTPSSMSTCTPIYTITSVSLPVECYGVSSKGGPSWREMCSDFEFSSDGRFLGFFFGPDICGRGIIILDTETAEIVYQTQGVGGGLGFEFLTNGKILISTGHCEGGQIGLLDPVTGEFRRLGGLGRGGWNAARTAIAVETGTYQGVERAIWGYNIEQDFLFLPQPEDWQQVDDHLLWSPDGTHILYLHRPISYTSRACTFSGPSQIIRVDIATGEKQVWAGDPQYGYYFCKGAYNWCDQWYEDWIQVRRFPFEVQSIKFTDDFFHRSDTTCLLYGMNCVDTPELFALNWRTGDLITWDEALSITLTPGTTPANSDGWFIP